ncbi:DUF3253 domain-containing protein [Tianweitania sp.]|uniref:DUF3253 domain-containing protein n=1 Tax=Tianweitania sp. TaxID=2021634 RepID=UPI003A102A26
MKSREISDIDARTEVLGFVQKRHDGSTCPSEVARRLASKAGIPESWRGYMPVVHLAVDELCAEGKISLSWKAVPMAKRDGPYRICKPRG